MAYEQHLDDFPTCSEIPHVIFGASIIYCPHDQGWTLHVDLGDEAGNVWSQRTTRYGPFDDMTNVAYDLAQYLRVLGRRQLIEGALIEHRGEDWWQGVGRGHGQRQSKT